MIKCLNCGRRAATVNKEGMRCTNCGYAWSFEDEKAQEKYIKTVLRRALVEPETQDGDVQASPAESKADASDLTQIKGIGPTTAKTLASIGITNMRELAGASLSEIEAVVSASSKEIAGWILQAGEFLDA